MNTIQASYLARAYNNPLKSNEAKKQTQSASFLEQVSAGAAERNRSASMDTFQTQKSTETNSVSLESMLKAKYPNLVYNVGDATSSDWNNRHDYPYESLFQEGEQAVERIENFKAVGSNPERRKSLAVAPNSKAVMIHPKAQERMEKDPEFAKEVMERIESWWAYDIARNEAITPGCTIGMSQAIAIGEDGEIANSLSCGGTNPVRNNKNNDNDRDEYDWWAERMARHDMFMQLWLERKTDINRISSMGDSSLSSISSGFSLNSMLAIQSGLSAEQNIINMLQNGLKEKLGDTVCGMPTDEVIAQTWADIEKCRAIRNTMMM